MRHRFYVVFLMGCLLSVVGCASETEDALPEPIEGGAPSSEAYLEDAAARYEAGEYAEAAALARAGLMGATAFRVTPELLYLIGASELALGNEEEAALSLDLLMYYYPRRWAVLPERERFTAVVEDWRTRTSHGLAGRGSGPGTPFGIEGSEEPGASAATQYVSGNPHPNPLVTNVFYETDIYQTLADISSQVGIPIIGAEGLRGYITMEFIDLPLEECLRRLAVPLGLGYRWMDGYYLVGVADPGDPGSVLLSEVVEIRPRHLLAKDALKMLPEGYGQYVRFDATGGNTLSVAGPPEVLRAFLRDLAIIDRPPQQVMIEALVVEVDSDMAREWGIDWGVLGTTNGDIFRIAKLTPALIDSAFIGQLLQTGVDLFGGVASVRVAVRALEASGGASVKANPHVATLDGQEARIRVGTEAYYSLLSGSVTYAYYTLEKIATGTTLRITPYIMDSSEIVTDISVEVSDVRSFGVDDLPVTSVREVETTARVDNGESVIIGGLLAERERTEENRIPILGRIPIIGGLFGYTSIEKEESEMFVLVTPHIMIHPTELASLIQ
jgi:type II secretory pathway component HofQ